MVIYIIMDTYHIAKLIQIFGILVGTGFGTILLNPEIVGKLAHRINSRFLSIGHTVTERYSAFLQYLMPGGEFPPIVVQAMSSSIIICSAWAVLLIALQRNIVWVFWLSVSIIGMYAFIAVVDTVLRFIVGRPRRYPLWLFPILLAVRLVSGLVFFPIVVFIFLIANYLLILIVFVFNSIAGRDIIRRGLIISGFLLVLTGLILEFTIAD